MRKKARQYNYMTHYFDKKGKRKTEIIKAHNIVEARRITDKKAGKGTLTGVFAFS